MSSFNDNDGPTGYLGARVAVRLTIRCGTVVDSIETEWNDGNKSPRNGGGGGGSDLFALVAGEVITSFTTWADGDKITGLQMNTSQGRVSKIWGLAKGVPIIHQSPANKSGLVSFNALAGFSGKVRKDNTLETLNAIWSTSPPTFGGRFLYIGPGARGGEGGNTFSDISSCGDISTAHLVQITGRSGSAVDAMQFTYDNGTTTDRHGGNGGGEKIFTVPAGQFITQVKGKSGSEIDQIQFITNKAVQSPVYGGNGGGDFIFTAPTEANGIPHELVGNMGLLGFVGRCGSKMDRFSPVWAPVAPISYELISVQYDKPGPDVVLSERQEPYGNNKIINNTPITKVDSDSYTKTYNVTHTHTLSNESATTIGAEVNFKISVPELGEAGGSITSSVSNTTSVTNGVEQSTTFSNTRSLDLTTPPYSILETRLSTIGAQISAVNWRGKMRVTLYNNVVQIYDVTGTLSGALSTLLQVAYFYTPMESGIENVSEAVARL